MDYQVLWNEISTDPLSRGYATMTDAEIAGDMNQEYREVMDDTLSSAQLYEATDITEYDALDTAQKEHFRVILGLGGSIDVSDGSKARTRLLDWLGVQSNTIQALIVVLTRTVSRAAELGLPSLNARDVTTARERYGG